MRTVGGPVRLPKVPNSKMVGRPKPPIAPTNVAGPGNVPGAMVAGTPAPRPMGMKVGGFVAPSSFKRQDDKKDVQFRITKPTKGGGHKGASGQIGEGRSPKVPSLDGGKASSRSSKVGMPGKALSTPQPYRTR